MRIASGIGVLTALALIPLAAVGQPEIAIYTDAEAYQDGDTIQVSVAAVNEGEAIAVDVYIGLIVPDGSLWTRGELMWSEGVRPWISDFYMPSGFAIGRTISSSGYMSKYFFGAYNGT